MPKRVWILGAGASKEMGYPLGMEVIKGLVEGIDNEIRNTCKDVEKLKNGCESCDSVSKMCRNLMALLNSIWVSFEQIYGHNHMEKIDFEDYFSKLRILNEGYKDKNDNRIEKYISAFLRLYYWYLHHLKDNLKLKLNSADFSGRKVILQKYLQLLNPTEDLVVTTNQDVILETFLSGKSANDENNPIVNRPYSYNPRQISDSNFLSIIKLHGSANWVLLKKELISGTDRAVLAWPHSETEFSKYAVVERPAMEVQRLEELGEIPIGCFMMTPDIFKGLRFTNSPGEEIEKVFRDLCDAVSKELQLAEQIIIVGFSARPADFLCGHDAEFESSRKAGTPGDCC